MRRKLDAYFTPESPIKALIANENFDGLLYECCNGQGDIAKNLRERGYKVLTNDIDKKLKAHRHCDASLSESWAGLKIDWTITNPPFKQAAEILRQAYWNSNKGVAFLLRISFLEPCNNRADFLSANPPSRVYILPRISFTGDGKTDNVTLMWAVWDKTTPDQKIKVITKEELQKV